MIRLIDYEDKYQPDFKRLNLEWLEKYNLVESHDLEILDDPRGNVIETGGCIFLVSEDDKIIGTAGLWKENSNEYELIKMTVDPASRGKGISKILLEKCLEKARSNNATKIFLYSNSQLTAAIRLYEKYGFRHVPVTDAPFLTADIKMELIF